MAACRFDKLVDIVVSPTLLDLDGSGLEGTALLLPVPTDPAAHDAVTPSRVGTSQPQGGVGATLVNRGTPLWHLQALPFVEEAVPPLPVGVTVTHLMLGAGIGGPPCLVQDCVAVAGVKVGHGVCVFGRPAFNFLGG